MKHLFFPIAIILMALLFAMALFGCAPNQTPATKAAIQQVQQQTQIDQAKIDAQAQLSAARAKANPLLHPLSNSNAVVKKAQAPLGLIATIAFLAFAVGVGLYFTPLSAFSKILVPLGGSVAALSFIGLIALPFFPWVIGGGAALLVGLLVYEIIRYKSLKGAIQGFEEDLGLASAKIVPVPVAIPVQLTHT